MTYAFAMLVAGTVLLTAAVKNRSVLEIFQGITSPQPGGGTGFKAGSNSTAAGVQGGASGIVTGEANVKGKIKGKGRAAAKRAVKEVTRGVGLSISDTNRPGGTQTSSGNLSDHSVSCLECYAEDLSGSVAAMNRAAIKICARLGHNYNGTSELILNKEYKGYRIQVLYHTQTGGNHENHIHVGARKIGYSP